MRILNFKNVHVTFQETHSLKWSGTAFKIKSYLTKLFIYMVSQKKSVISGVWCNDV